MDEPTEWVLECLDRKAEETAAEISKQHGEPWTEDSTLVGQAATCIRSLQSKLDTAERALERHGYRRSCNIPAPAWNPSDGGSRNLRGAVPMLLGRIRDAGGQRQ